MSDEKRCTCEEDASNLGSPPCAKCFIGEPTGEWWCQKCQAYVHPRLVTNDEVHEFCGCPVYVKAQTTDPSGVVPMGVVTIHALVEACAALDMQPCLCRDGFICSRCKGLAAFKVAGIKVPERDSDGDGLIPQIERLKRKVGGMVEDQESWKEEVAAEFKHLTAERDALLDGMREIWDRTAAMSEMPSTLARDLHRIASRHIEGAGE